MAMLRDICQILFGPELCQLFLCSMQALSVCLLAHKTPAAAAAAAANLFVRGFHDQRSSVAISAFLSSGSYEAWQPQG